MDAGCTSIELVLYNLSTLSNTVALEVFHLQATFQKQA